MILPNGFQEYINREDFEGELHKKGSEKFGKEGKRKKGQKKKGGKIKRVKNRGKVKHSFVITHTFI